MLRSAGLPLCYSSMEDFVSPPFLSEEKKLLLWLSTRPGVTYGDGGTYEPNSFQISKFCTEFGLNFPLTLRSGNGKFEFVLEFVTNSNLYDWCTNIQTDFIKAVKNCKNLFFTVFSTFSNLVEILVHLLSRLKFLMYFWQPFKPWGCLDNGMNIILVKSRYRYINPIFNERLGCLHRPNKACPYLIWKCSNEPEYHFLPLSISL